MDNILTNFDNYFTASVPRIVGCTIKATVELRVPGAIRKYEPGLSFFVQNSQRQLEVRKLAVLYPHTSKNTFNVGLALDLSSVV